MAEQLLTKCPHCGTTFRLSQQHLQIAGGAVRCGACYQVFHASEYIVKTAVVEEIQQPQPAATAQAALPDPMADFNVDDIDGLDAYAEAELDLNHPDEDLFADDYHQKLTEGGDTSNPLAFDDDTAPASKSAAKSGGGDEDWAKQLLEELGETLDDLDTDDEEEDRFSLRKKKAPLPQTNTHFSSIQSSQSAFDDIEPVAAKPAPASPRAPQKQKRLEEELSDSFKNLGLKGFSNDPFSIDDIEEEEKDTSDVDESWAKAMLEELEGDKLDQRKKHGDSLAFTLEDDEEEDSPFAAKPLSRNKDEAIQKARKNKPKAAASTPKFAAPLPDHDDDKDESYDVYTEFDDAPAAKKSNISSFDDEFFKQFDESQLEIEDIHLEDAVGALHSLEDEQEPSKPKMSPADIAARVRAHAAQLEMEQAPRTHYFKTAMLVIGNVLMLCILVLQFAYFKFDELSRRPALRPLYALACAELGCTLPAQTDTSKIRTNNLVVRSHPTADKALSIDAMISNEASYNQPFPIIELTFEDINGNLVASRGFEPDEYIKDPSIDTNNMVAGTPFHVGLEIVDPGPAAVNYHLRFLPMPD